MQSRLFAIVRPRPAAWTAAGLVSALLLIGASVAALDQQVLRHAQWGAFDDRGDGGRVVVPEQRDVSAVSALTGGALAYGVERSAVRPASGPGTDPVLVTGERRRDGGSRLARRSSSRRSGSAARRRKRTSRGSDTTRLRPRSGPVATAASTTVQTSGAGTTTSTSGTSGATSGDGGGGKRGGSSGTGGGSGSSGNGGGSGGGNSSGGGSGGGPKLQRKTVRADAASRKATTDRTAGGRTASAGGGQSRGPEADADATSHGASDGNGKR